MMLDDFFTLTEINNGLTIPSRVKELVAIMQKQSDSAVKNVGEASRQWSAVGSAIAATVNQECLDLFIQLNGLHFIGKWLKDAQNFSSDLNDSFLVESIVHLLQALRKLNVDYEKLVSADLWTTVNDLVHNSSKVKDEAQVLIDNWKKKRDGDEFVSHDETLGVITNDVGKGGHSESSQKDDSLFKETSYKEKEQEASSEVEHPDQVFDRSVEDNPPSNHASSPSLPKAEMELPSCHSANAISVESCNPETSRENTCDGNGLMGFHELESVSVIKHSPKTVSLSEKSGSIKELNSSEPLTACSDVAEATKSVAEPSPRELCEAGNKSLSDEGSLCVDSRKTDSDGKCSINRGSENECRNDSDTTEEGGECRTLCKSSSPEKIWGNKTDVGASRSGIEDLGKMRNLDLHVSGDDLVNDYNFTKKDMHREPDRACTKSDVELYGIIDPLEVARQVAREVEREVVDNREQSCSSSDKLPDGNLQKPGTPNSVSGRQSHSSEGSPNDKANSPDASGEASPMQEESGTSSENLNVEQANGTQDIETPQVMEGVQVEINTERVPCSFDLNEEVFSEDAERSTEKLFKTVSIVSASRAAAPPGLPVAPLQFEGNLGWKGSAATSAFRPASPRRLPENEDIFTLGNSNSSKQQQRCLDIDLNVAESVDGGAGDLLQNNNFPLYSNLLPGESSAIRNPRPCEPLYLDLNLSSEDGEQPPDLQVGQFFSHANGHRNWSHASSSSSSKQPSLINFDLNDRPLFLNDQSDNSYLQSDNSYLTKLSQSCNAAGGIRLDDSAISILGTRVEIRRKELVSPALPNGRTAELPFDANFGRTGTFMWTGSVPPYAHSSVYSCNNILPGSAMPFSSAMYGSVPMPYVMDSTVVPQIVGNPSALPAGLSQMPFIMNITNPTSSSGVGALVPSWNSFDLNSGGIVEGGGLNTGRVRSMDEQLRSNTQLSMGSVANGKRKEPDNGLEQYPLRHYTPPWK